MILVSHRFKTKFHQVNVVVILSAWTSVCKNFLCCEWMRNLFKFNQHRRLSKMCRFSLPLYFVGVIYLCVKIASSKVVQIWTEVMGRWKSCISIVYLYSHEYNLFIIHCVASWPKILLSYQLQNVQARLKNIIIWMIRIIYCTVFEFVCFMLFVWFLFCLFVPLFEKNEFKIFWIQSTNDENFMKIWWLIDHINNKFIQ